MNEASIISFKNNCLIISRSTAKEKLNNKITNVLLEITGLNISITTANIDSSKEKTLKDNLIKSFKTSNEWKSFSNKIKSAKVIDLTHNQWKCF